MSAYLDPLLRNASNFLEGQADRNNQLVPIYLLATAGMRTAFKDIGEEERIERRKQILNQAWIRMRSFPHFDAGEPPNARVITGQTEGLLAWVANNYARGEPTMGIFEIGGSSTQFAFSKQSDNYTKKICSFSKQDGYDVYSRSWDGLGVADANKTLTTKLERTEGGQLANPCLPKFYKNAFEDMVGTGDFVDCRRKTFRVLADEGGQDIPHYIEGTPFVGISNPMYSYDFFSRLKDTPGFKINEPYNYQLYRDAVEGYCDNDTFIPDDRPKQIILNTCFVASWMLELLHSNAGFAMPMDNNRGLLTFPHKGEPDLMTQSSWTLGVAALIARHNGLVGCPRGEPLPLVPFDNSTRLGEVDWPPIFLPSDLVDSSFHDGYSPIFPPSDSIDPSLRLHHVVNISPDSVSDSNCPIFMTISSIGAFSVILIGMIIFVYRRGHSISVGKIALPRVQDI